MSGVVPQECQLLPIETHQPRSEQLHQSVPAICDNCVSPQGQDRQQHDVPLDEEPRVDLLLEAGRCSVTRERAVRGGQALNYVWTTENWALRMHVSRSLPSNRSVNRQGGHLACRDLSTSSWGLNTRRAPVLVLLSGGGGGIKTTRLLRLLLARCELLRGAFCLKTRGKGPHRIRHDGPAEPRMHPPIPSPNVRFPWYCSSSTIWYEPPRRRNSTAGHRTSLVEQPHSNYPTTLFRTLHPGAQPCSQPELLSFSTSSQSMHARSWCTCTRRPMDVLDIYPLQNANLFLNLTTPHQQASGTSAKTMLSLRCPGWLLQIAPRCLQARRPPRCKSRPSPPGPTSNSPSSAISCFRARKSSTSGDGVYPTRVPTRKASSFRRCRGSRWNASNTSVTSLGEGGGGGQGVQGDQGSGQAVVYHHCCSRSREDR